MNIAWKMNKLALAHTVLASEHMQFLECQSAALSLTFALPHSILQASLCAFSSSCTLVLVAACTSYACSAALVLQVHVHVNGTSLLCVYAPIWLLPCTVLHSQHLACTLRGSHCDCLHLSHSCAHCDIWRDALSQYSALFLILMHSFTFAVLCPLSRSCRHAPCYTCSFCCTLMLTCHYCVHYCRIPQFLPLSHIYQVFPSTQPLCLCITYTCFFTVTYFCSNLRTLNHESSPSTFHLLSSVK